MKLIKPSYEILTEIDAPKIYAAIERAGRICYKSEAKIGPGSAEELIKRLINSGHHSVLEHQGFSVKFICDRGVSHKNLWRSRVIY